MIEYKATRQHVNWVTHLMTLHPAASFVCENTFSVIIDYS